jgi:hypothetical protein
MLMWAVLSAVCCLAILVRFVLFVIINPDMLDLSIDVENDHILRLLVLVAICPTSIMLIHFGLDSCFGQIGGASWDRTLNKTELRFLALIFSFGLGDGNGSVCVSFSTLVLVSFYAAAWIQEKMVAVLTLAEGLSGKQHQGLLFCQVMLLLGVAYGMVLSCRLLDVVMLYHILCGLVISALSILLDIVGHLVFLLDPDELGNSVGTYGAFFVSEAIVKVLEFSVSLFFIICLLLESELPIFPMYQLYAIVNYFSNQYAGLRTWIRMRCVIEHLPTPDENDVVREDTCVICRLDMPLGSGRKLPCGHCFHPECIERWIARKLCCPVCGQNLKEALEEAERSLKCEAPERPVESGNRKFFRFGAFVK